MTTCSEVLRLVCIHLLSKEDLHAPKMVILKKRKPKLQMRLSGYSCFVITEESKVNSQFVLGWEFDNKNIYLSFIFTLVPCLRPINAWHVPIYQDYLIAEHPALATQATPTTPLPRTQDGWPGHEGKQNTKVREVGSHFTNIHKN